MSGELELPECTLAVSMTAQQAVHCLSRRLSQAGVVGAHGQARMMVEHVTAQPLILAPRLTSDHVKRLHEMAEQRCSHVPLQHLMGVMWFRYLELQCRPGVFIVRPETEVVAGWAIEQINSGELMAHSHRDPLGVSRADCGENGPVKVLDLCTGSGAIAASVASECPNVHVVAVDISALACELAAVNCSSPVIADCAQRVRVVCADVLSLAEVIGPEGERWRPGDIDCVIANPPYVPDGDVEDLETLHDPALALFGGGADGTRFPAALLRHAASLLRPGGVVVMEHDWRQGAVLSAVAREAGYVDVAVRKDLTGRERFLTARLA